MSTPALQEDQLLELLLQLKKTTPDQARAILNSQPQISYALMAVMVNLNAINMEVVQKTLTSFGALPGGAPATLAPPPAPTPVPPLAPASALPPHMVAQSQPRGGTPTYASQPQPTIPYAAQPSYGHPPNGPQGMPGYGAPPPAPAPAPAAMIPDALAGIPDDQKALIMRVISMTPDQVRQLPPQERQSIIQLRATLGLPT